MALTEPEAKVLATLAILEPAQGLTVRELCVKTSLAAATVRAALAIHRYAGRVLDSSRTPTEWRITADGRVIIGDRRYRDFLPRNGATNGNGAHR